MSYTHRRGTIPFIGPWLYLRTAHRTAAAAVLGDEKAVRELIAELCSGRDLKVRDIADRSLRSLGTSSTVDLLCDEVMSRDDPYLERIAIDCGYEPSDKAKRALFFFISGQQAQFNLLDPGEHHPLLARGYAYACRRARARSRKIAGKTGGCSLFASIFLGPGIRQNTGVWLPEEWGIIVDGLIDTAQWEELWLLIFSAPLPQAVTALHAMKRSGWSPAGDSQHLWEEILTLLPDSWMYPAPSLAGDTVIGSRDGQTTKLVFSPDGGLLAAADCEGVISVWRMAHGILLHTLRTGSGSISALAFSPDGTRLICCGEGEGLQCWDLQTGSRGWSLLPGGRGTGCCAFTPDGESVIAGDEGGTVYRADTVTGKLTPLFQGTGGAVTCIVVQPGAMAAGFADGSICICTLADTTVFRRIPSHGAAVRMLAFSGDGKTITAFPENSLPSGWDRESGDRTSRYSGYSGRTGCSAIAQDGSWFAIAGEDRLLRIWQCSDTLPATVIPFYNRYITCCAPSPDNELLVCGCNDGTLRTVRVTDGKLCREQKGHARAISALTISPDGRQLATAGWDGAVKVRDLRTGEILHTLKRKTGPVTGIALSPCGGMVIGGYTGGTARIYNLQERSLLREIPLYTNRLKAIALHPGGILLASAGGDATLRLWNTSDGSLVANLEGLTTTASCLAFTGDGKILVSGGWDGKVRCWEVPGGRQVSAWKGHTSTITCCAVSPDGSLLVTGSNDTTGAIWQLAEGQRITALTGSRSEVSAVAISPAGDLLAAGGADSVLRLYQLPSGNEEGSIPVLPGKITTLVFTGDSQLLVAGYDTGIIAIVSRDEQRLIRSFGGHTGPVSGVGITPDGNHLVSGGHDGTIRVFSLPWTKPLSRTMLEDMPGVDRQCSTAVPDTMKNQWLFLRCLLAGRFNHEIGLCSLQDDAGVFDIQIVG